MSAKPDSAKRSKVSSECGDVIEFEVAGARLRMRGQVDEMALMTVLRTLRRIA